MGPGGGKAIRQGGIQILSPGSLFATLVVVVVVVVGGPILRLHAWGQATTTDEVPTAWEGPRGSKRS